MLSLYVRLMSAVDRFQKDKSGVTAIEYGVIAVGIVIAIAVIFATVGNQIEEAMQNVSGSLG